MDLKKLVGEAKERALALLKKRGITDTFTVKVKKIHNPERNLACYRANSQFRSGIIFWVSEEFPRVVRKFKQDLREQLVKTMLHEYGHVMWELIDRERRTHPELQELWDEVMEGYLDLEGVTGEESFAEDIASTLYGDWPADDLDKIIARYVEIVFEPTPSRSAA